MNDPVSGAVLLGLSAAATWGAGDFMGGYASKRSNVFGVVIGAEVIGLLFLIPLTVIIGDPIPEFNSWIMALAAGLSGGIGLILLYRTLAAGQMSTAAPVAAVVGAAIPVVVGMVLEGAPKATALIGIAIALVAILLTSYNGREASTDLFDIKRLTLPVIAGLLFGLFFIFLDQASNTSKFWPVAATRCSSLIFLTIFALLSQKSWLPIRKSWLLIGICGLLDTAGCVLYASATQAGRMDIAVVISSLYPASTILLAWLILKEQISGSQLAGIALALAAIILIVI